MKVKELIEKLQQTPPDALVYAPDLYIGGSVEVKEVEKVDEEWVDLILADE